MGLRIWGPIFFGALVCEPAAAYLQYSLRYNQQSCTGCHFSPVGGGPKTQAGKLFAAHGSELNPILANPYVSADFRMLYYLPKETAASKDGMGVMSGSVAGHAALDKDERVYLVLEHNVGGFTAAPYRDTYLLYKFKHEFFESVLAGRFRTPFGIVTDEHRTYTRIQSQTEWYSMETGLMLSGNPGRHFHYDWAVVNGTHTTGSSLGAGQAGHWGTVLNLRFIRTPYLAGMSAAYYNSGAGGRTRSRALSTYGGWTWKRWTLLGEFVWAEGFNSNLNRGFVSNSVYAATLTNSISHGWLGWLEYEFNPRLYGIYKFDLLTPDRDFPADRYERHGIGVRWNLAPLVWLQTRAEKAVASHPSERQGIGTGRLDAIFAVLQVSL